MMMTFDFSSALMDEQELDVQRIFSTKKEEKKEVWWNNKLGQKQ